MRQAFGGVSIAIAALVLAHFVFSPLYPDGVDIDLAWFYFNILMAFALVIGLVAQYGRLRRAHAEGGDAPVTRAYLEATVLFFLTALLTIMFAWNWVDDLVTGLGGEQSSNRLLFWAAIDSVFVLLTGTTGVQLWRER